MTNCSISSATTFPIQGVDISEKPVSPPNAAGNPISPEFLGAGLANMKNLGGAENKNPPKIESTNLEVARSMAQSSRTCVQKADSIGLRVGGFLFGAVRAVGLFFYSPVTALKYLIVALCQASKREGARALAALALAVTAPLWAPLDGFYKTYRRFGLYGDDKLASIYSKVYRNNEKTWLEKWKEVAKDEVIDPRKGWLDGGRSGGSMGGLGMCAGSCAC